jgi:murein DD-endopeptidase MepM/ murein hydrolase activator NlpD
MSYLKSLLKFFIILMILFLSGTTSQVSADSPKTNNKQEKRDILYTVQPGDTLIAIALRYNLTLAEIVLANDLLNPGLIFPGQLLILPDVPSPTPAAPPDPATALDQVHLVQPGDTIAGIADLYQLSVADLILFNQLHQPDMLHIGQRLRIPGDLLPTPEPPGYPFTVVQLSEPTISQGRVLVIRVTLAEPATLSGTFLDQPVRFFEAGNRQYWSIVAIHALLDANSYPLTLVATLPDGRTATRVEELLVIEGPYGSENIWLDNNRSALLQPELIQVEREKLLNLWSQVSPYPRWSGPFWYPVALDSLKITSYFGTRRHYNGSSQLSFHDGTDFGGGVGTPIYAPAAGIVVLAERLTVRGNAVLIDHGLGLYSGYWHQSQIVVTEGQEVRPGELLGYIGDTGLVTGPHLHWEMRLNGIAVNPLQWVRESIP